MRFMWEILYLSSVFAGCGALAWLISILLGHFRDNCVPKHFTGIKQSSLWISMRRFYFQEEFCGGSWIVFEEPTSRKKVWSRKNARNGKVLCTSTCCEIGTSCVPLFCRNRLKHPNSVRVWQQLVTRLRNAQTAVALLSNWEKYLLFQMCFFVRSKPLGVPLKCVRALWSYDSA